ncbi:MAG: energy-coupling factor transporter transmembrane component T family protein [Anaerolineales bacterium]
MLVTWRYRNLKTIVHRLDPRTKVVSFVCFILAALSFWDVRVLGALLLFGVLQILLARIPWRDIRRVWLFIFIMASLFTVITFLTGRGGFELYTTEHEIARITAPFRLFGWQPEIPVTAERLAEAAGQFLRILAVTSFAIGIPYTIDPRVYGVTFHRLGLPDKFAYAIDLSLRFVPTFARDFAVTYDAQRARGYELERVRSGLLAQIRRMAPLLIPVVIQAIVGGEEIIDAMDLRSFGIRPRTWLMPLRFRWIDAAWLALSAAVFAAAIVLPILGIGQFWVPPFLLP